MSELLSYGQFLRDIKNFKKAGASSGSDFSIYDTPGHKYFKIMFYFGSEPDDFASGSTGFLAPTWEFINKGYKFNGEDKWNTLNKYNGNRGMADALGDTLDDVMSGVGGLFNRNRKPDEYYMHNSAWAYLMNNDENERAEKLQKFITLLSDINSNSPWYFKTVGGIGDALDRKPATSNKFEIPDEDKKLTISCMPDAFDNRIGTLLELYRDITWSWIQKREVVPANLRKFDMAIYIFETPEVNWHNPPKTAFSQITSSINGLVGANIIKEKTADDVVLGGTSDNNFKPSYKMLEFHDCEFEYNSIKSGWSGELSNETGFNPSYTIEIKYKDCFEISYNDIMMRTIGDVIKTDTLNAVYSEDEYKSQWQTDSTNQAKFIKEKTHPYDKGLIGNTLNQLKNHLAADVAKWINKATLGNLYSTGLSDIKGVFSKLGSGDAVGATMAVVSSAKKRKVRKANRSRSQENDYMLVGHDVTPNDFDSSNELDYSNIYINEADANGQMSKIAIDSVKRKYLGNIFSDVKKPNSLARNSLANNL